MRQGLLMVSMLAAFGLVRLDATHSPMPTLGINSPPPPLSVGHWLKGAPIESFETGIVYVVVFWNTRCDSCSNLISELSEVARRHKDEARVVGISVFEREVDDEARLQRVRDFLAPIDGQVEIALAMDAPGGRMAKTWLWAADETSVPTAFLIDKEGLIAWIGEPTPSLGSTISRSIEGVFDRKAASEQRAKAREMQRKNQETLRHLSDLWQQKRYPEALAALDHFEAERPDYKKGLIQFRYNLLLEADEPAAYRFAGELAEGEYKDDANNLAGIARSICDTPYLKNPDYALALRLARQACELSQNQNPRHLAALSEVYHRTREHQKAIDSMNRAIAAARRQATPEALASIEELENRLQRFKEASR